MRPVEVEVIVQAPRAEVWSLVSDIDRAAETISGIESVEVLERPGEGILGLRWKETRTLYGKSATETMWITDVDEGSSYATEARSHGSVYRTRIRLDDADGGTRLGMEFSAEPTTLAARILSGVFGPLIARSVRKALLQDLRDVKAAAELASPA